MKILRPLNLSTDEFLSEIGICRFLCFQNKGFLINLVFKKFGQMNSVIKGTLSLM